MSAVELGGLPLCTKHAARVAQDCLGEDIDANDLQDVRSAQRTLRLRREREERWRDRAWTFVAQSESGRIRVGVSADVPHAVKGGEKILMTRKGVALAAKLRRLEPERLAEEVAALCQLERGVSDVVV